MVNLCNDIQTVFWYVPESGKEHVLSLGNERLKKLSHFFVYRKDAGISLKAANRTEFRNEYSVWCQNLGAISELANATVSISDNIAAPLELRPDTIMIGSFLWSDILPEKSENLGVIEKERELLLKCKPTMLHIEHFGMPALTHYTIPVPLPWVTEKKPVSLEHKNNILITSGKSGQDIELFANVAKELGKQFPTRTFVDGAIYEHLGHEVLPKFSFQDADFMRLGTIVCRPGIGIITEAVTYGIPILTFNDFGNAELDYNAAQIEQLGIGISFSKEDSSDVVAKAVNNTLNSTEFRFKLIGNLANQKDGGAKVAAEYILDTISHD